jgi:hypothetical protein
MTFTETWIAEETLNRLQELVCSVQHIDGDLIEFGLWEGRSFVRIADAAAPRVVHGVDYWESSHVRNILGHIGQPRDRNVYQAFCDNTKHLTNIQIHKTSTTQFMETYSGQIAFLHIDADHDYERIAADISAALPYLAPDAIMCGDDYSQRFPGVMQAVQQLLPNFTVEREMWIYRNEER